MAVIRVGTRTSVSHHNPAHRAAFVCAQGDETRNLTVVEKQVLQGQWLWLFVKCLLRSHCMPRPVLSPRDTKMNEAGIAVVMLVCFLLPFFHSFIPQIYCVTAMCHALDWVAGNVKKINASLL